MGKGEKTGLRRLLVKHHNQMIQQSKEKGTYYRSQQKKVLESVTEVNDIDAVIEQTDEAHSLFSSINSATNLSINLDPLFYRCPDLEAYAQEIDEHKRTLLLINKADFLPFSVREKWARYFNQNGILFLFWSAKASSAALEGKTPSLSSGVQNIQHELACADAKYMAGMSYLLVCNLMLRI